MNQNPEERMERFRDGWEHLVHPGEHWRGHVWEIDDQLSLRPEEDRGGPISSYRGSIEGAAGIVAMRLAYQAGLPLGTSLENISAHLDGEL